MPHWTDLDMSPKERASQSTNETEPRSAAVSFHHFVSSVSTLARYQFSGEGSHSGSLHGTVAGVGTTSLYERTRDSGVVVTEEGTGGLGVSGVDMAAGVVGLGDVVVMIVFGILGDGLGFGGLGLGGCTMGEVDAGGVVCGGGGGIGVVLGVVGRGVVTGTGRVVDGVGVGGESWPGNVAPAYVTAIRLYGRVEHP